MGAGAKTTYLYDGADLLTETDAAGTLTARYLIGPRIDEPLELTRGTTTHYYSADVLGSIALLTTSAGAPAESYTYDPFGTPTIKNASGTVIPSSALGNPFLFTAREWDSETALYFYRARYYKPAMGRFLSRDPLGAAPDVNLYRYVGNNPLTYVDPDGWLSLMPGGLGGVGAGGLGPHVLPVPMPPQSIDIPQFPQPERPVEPTPPPHTPPGPDLFPEGNTPGLGEQPKQGKGQLGGTQQPGISQAGGQEQGSAGGKVKGGKKPPKAKDVKDKGDLPDYKQWPSEPTRSGKGTKYRDPANRGRTVREMDPVTHQGADPVKRSPGGYIVYTDGYGGDVRIPR